MKTIYIIFDARDEWVPILWAEDKELAEAEAERLSRIEYEKVLKHWEHIQPGKRPDEIWNWTTQTFQTFEMRKDRAYWVQPLNRLEGDEAWLGGWKEMRRG